MPHDIKFTHALKPIFIVMYNLGRGAFSSSACAGQISTKHNKRKEVLTIKYLLARRQFSVSALYHILKVRSGGRTVVFHWHDLPPKLRPARGGLLRSYSFTFWLGPDKRPIPFIVHSVAAKSGTTTLFESLNLKKMSYPVRQLARCWISWASNPSRKVRITYMQTFPVIRKIAGCTG